MIKTDHKKAVIFISSGLGDALLLIPLVKLMKERGYQVTGMVTSPFPCEQLFEDTGLFEQLIIARSKVHLLKYVLKHRRRFQLAILNYFSAGRSTLLAAKQLSPLVHTNRLPDTLGKNTLSGVLYIQPEQGIHDAVQNMMLAGEGIKECNESMLSLDMPLRHTLDLPENYIVLQISAANNKQTYKNWPLKYWIRFLQLCKQQLPSLSFVLLGDKTETDLADELMQAGIGNVKNLAGKTSVMQAMEVIGRSRLFVGLDGGLMHAAVVLGKPTFSLWGPSSPALYGYEKMIPDKHRVISLYLACAPCSAWIKPNTSRVNDPERCPDHKCLQELKAEQVFGEFSIFVKKHALI
jgi:ADP-heptose:LPS heptosyltransferase